MKEYLNADLDIKYKILAFISFNNTNIISFILNLYIRFLSNLGIKNKIKEFKIKKVTDVHYTVDTEEGIINTPTVFRCLNFSSGFNKRIEFLANSYGSPVFENVFKKNASNIIDIGANIGEFSIYCVKRNSNVFSIEHDKAAYSMLKLNTKKFFDKINTFNLTISNNSGFEEIFYDTITGGTTLIKPLKTDNYKNLDFKKFSPEKKVVSKSNSLTLDDFIEKNKISLVDLIKCDAEGAEPEIIQGLKKNSEKVDYIAIDTIGERNGEDTTETVVKLLLERNFKILKRPENKIGRTVIAKNKNLN